MKGGKNSPSQIRETKFPPFSLSTLPLNKSIVANSSHSSLMNSSDLRHLKQHQSSQKYFLKRNATRVRHMATQKISGPWIKLKTMAMYWKDVICSNERVNVSHQIAMTMKNFVNKSKLQRKKERESKWAFFAR